jgi:hypothetical protein
MLRLGEWLHRLANRRSEREFGNQIREIFPFLFELYGGQIIPNAGRQLPLAFDGAVVTVACVNCFIRFSRCRGELSVEVARKNQPWGWDELSEWLAEGDDDDFATRNSSKRPHGSLKGFSDWLRPRMGRLIESFGELSVDE